MLIAFYLNACATTTPPPAVDFTNVNDIIQDAIDQAHIPGAVLLVGRGNEVLHRRAYGMRAIKPTPEPMTTDTVFDLASLTKPVATATSIMTLVDRGRVRLDAKAGEYLPGFANNGKEAITVEQLLTHVSGLTPDNHLRDYADGRVVAIRKINALAPRWTPGAEFHYSDVGYIVLGEIVTKVSGQSLDAFAQQNVFEPLGMSNTGFNPSPNLRPRIAPTAFEGGAFLRGRVHDPRAAAMGGVAGHAGLFANVDDLARYCRMILNGGTGRRGRVLSAVTVVQMLAPRSVVRPTEPGEPPARDVRNLGFDVDTAYSSARGDAFPVGSTFGHTGFTGPSMWIDPQSGLYYVFLCSRLHPDGSRSVVDLRRRIATAVAEAALVGSK
ncbi:MAG: serine hydrolase domain-containing protein [Planctomycetota bacterium]